MAPHRVPPERPPKPRFSPKSQQNGLYPKVSDVPLKKKEPDDLVDRDYEVLSSNARIKPTRPAPQPPISPSSSLVSSVSNYGTLPGSSDLDGVPFVLNPRLSLHADPAFVRNRLTFLNAMYKIIIIIFIPIGLCFKIFFSSSFAETSCD